MNFLDIIKNSGYSCDERYLNRYLDFVSYCARSIINEGDPIEKHHILPRSMFPEYELIEENIISLSARSHFLCHWMLAKTFGGKMWFAFNMMKRVGGTSMLYQYARGDISKIISNTNKGRIKTEEERASISERFTNKVVVKDQNGKRFQIDITDERYLNGELVYHKTGSSHSANTKAKMSENNGIRGKTRFINHDGTTIYLPIEVGIEMGLQQGESQKTKTKKSLSKKGKMWVNIKSTGKDKLIDPIEFDETLHIKGRLNGPGFSIINNNKLNVGDNHWRRRNI